MGGEHRWARAGLRGSPALPGVTPPAAAPHPRPLRAHREAAVVHEALEAALAALQPRQHRGRRAVQRHVRPPAAAGTSGPAGGERGPARGPGRGGRSAAGTVRALPGSSTAGGPGSPRLRHHRRHPGQRSHPAHRGDPSHPGHPGHLGQPVTPVSLIILATPSPVTLASPVTPVTPVTLFILVIPATLINQSP